MKKSKKRERELEKKAEEHFIEALSTRRGELAAEREAAGEYVPVGGDAFPKDYLRKVENDWVKKRIIH